MRTLNRVHLNGLRAAEATARLGGHQAAADELGVSVGAVSQHVVKLERALGGGLFERTPRGLRPTARGARLLGRLGAAFAEIDAALVEAFAEDDLLTLSVAPVFAAKWLVPRLGAFARAHPGLRVRLDASTELRHPDRSDIDLAIRIGDGRWPGVRAEFLLAQDVFPVCAPALAARLATPRDLLDAPVVRDVHAAFDWPIWLAAAGLAGATIGPGHEYPDASLALDAAIAGQGVMLAWRVLANDALADGRLVAPFAQRSATGLGYFVVTSAQRRPPEKVRRFIDWLRAEMPPDAEPPARA